MPSLCRSCDAISDGATRLCARCGSRLSVDHAELLTLAIAHVDCDAFYASVEKRDRPELAAKPLIVGGGQRGVVTTACYIARLSGVRSAMPMFKAIKLCPEAVIIPPNMAKYATESRRIRALMRDLTPLVEPLSIDEAALDLSGTEALHRAPPAVMLARLARRVETEIGVTISIGLGPNRLLAKLAAERDKPRGFSVIGAEAAALRPYRGDIQSSRRLRESISSRSADRIPGRSSECRDPWDRRRNRAFRFSLRAVRRRQKMVRPAFQPSAPAIGTFPDRL